MNKRCLAAISRSYSQHASVDQLRLIFLGAPGSGKGTIAKKVREKYGLESLSSGDILRATAEEESPLGRMVKEVISSGKLLEDSLMVEMMENSLKQWPANKGIILDGFPRTVDQAKELDGMVTRIGMPLDGVVSIKVAPEVIIERLSGRRVHPGSGRVYHVDYNPPKVEGVDDVTGEPLVQRSDDTVEVILSRLQIYEETAQPLRDHYDNMNLLHVIESETSDIGFQRLEQVLPQLIGSS